MPYFMVDVVGFVGIEKRFPQRVVNVTVSRVTYLKKKMTEVQETGT